MTVLKKFNMLSDSDIPGLQPYKAADYLHIVLYPVMDFLEESVLLFKRSSDMLFNKFSLGDVRNRYEYLRPGLFIARHDSHLQVDKNPVPINTNVTSKVRKLI